jgi:hypothetical protein
MVHLDFSPDEDLAKGYLSLSGPVSLIVLLCEQHMGDGIQVVTMSDKVIELHSEATPRSFFKATAHLMSKQIPEATPMVVILRKSCVFFSGEDT